MGACVIACGVMARELERLAGRDVRCAFLDQGLHQNPAQMAGRVQEAVRAVEEEPEQVILGYGLCCNGIVGVQAGRHPLWVPKVHDCLALLLGSARRYQEEQEREPGTYYLTRGWIEAGAAPLDKLAAYRQVMDPEDAEWGLREEFKHYKRLLWIETGVDPAGTFRERALENARFLGLRFEETRGDEEMLRALVRGSCADWIRIPPGETVKASLFY